jgi:radical SAM-linked protein
LKYLIEYEKREAVRWLGHLDVLRVFERAVRRSGLPVVYSQGFNPRQRIAFASALGVGATAGAEPAMIELRDPLDPPSVLDALNAVLPPGFRVTSAVSVPDADARRLINSYDRAELRLACDCDLTVDDAAVRSAARRLMERDHYVIAREVEGRRREVDVRAYLQELDAEVDRPGSVTIRATVAIGQAGTLRPAELVTAFTDGAMPLELRSAHRVRVFCSNRAAETDQEI